VRDDIANGTLKALPLGRGGLKRQWVLMYVKGAVLAEHDRAFIELCHKWFPQLMTEAETELQPVRALVGQGLGE
jgi:spermidine synthase